MSFLGAVGGDNDDSDDKEKEEEAERERQEAIREAEERRKEKHRKMEEEREKMRQEIRDKYNIKKKEELPEPQLEEPANPLMRKKKTPEELAREAEAEDQDEFTSFQKMAETVEKVTLRFDVCITDSKTSLCTYYSSI
ncbi:synaptic transmission protein complexin isoform X5 [Rhodnius prolixus]|uniref:synaptic transmission protein complexin isoform X5 n=1 Tax=Rhodnius prolixus TaxID=13249 RepID=UPI003D18D49E